MGLNVILSIVYVFALSIFVSKFFAIYQQNYYRAKNALSWFFNFNNKYLHKFYYLNIFFIFVKEILIIIINYFQLDYLFIFLINLISLCVIGVESALILKTKFKKSLKITKRVVRIYSVFIIIESILLVPILILSVNNILLTLLSSLPFLLMPLVVVFSNILLYPVELMIGNHYIKLAKAKLQSYPQLIVIGITGSYGKTSTKNYLEKILSQKYNVLASPNSFNTSMGVTRTILEYLKPHHEILILEMGADHKNDIEKICKIVKPNISIVTSVGMQHLKTFKTMENIILTKYQLVENTKSDGIFITNLTNNICKNYILKTSISTYAVGFNEGYCNIENYVCDENGTHINIVLDGIPISFDTKILGEFNIINIMLCVITGYRLGLNVDKLKQGVNSLVNTPHRLCPKVLSSGAILIDDSFNSNIEGFKGAIEVLKSFKDFRKILITCGVVELGDNQYQYNFSLGKLLLGIEVYVVNNVNYQALSDGIESVGGKVAKLYNDFETCYLDISKTLDKQCVVLIENDLLDMYIEN